MTCKNVTSTQNKNQITLKARSNGIGVGVGVGIGSITNLFRQFIIFLRDFCFCCRRSSIFGSVGESSESSQEA